MNHVTKNEMLEELIAEAENLPHRGKNELDALLRKTILFIRKVFDHDSHYLTDLKDIKFFPSVYFASSSDKPYNASWTSGHGKLINFLHTLKDDLNFPNELVINKDDLSVSNRVFVVHGHDNEMKSAVARMLEKLGLEAVILHEQDNKGKTIIEKFEANADVGFAVVLFSPDDMAFGKSSSCELARPRARQNVILELGYFYGKLGRGNVVTLFREAENFEFPSDILSVVYVTFDDEQAWQFRLAKELKAVGYEVKLNNLI